MSTEADCNHAFVNFFSSSFVHSTYCCHGEEYGDMRPELHEVAESPRLEIF